MRQEELNLFEGAACPKPRVKEAQMRRLRLAKTVVVNLEEGSVTCLSGAEIAKAAIVDQMVVPNEQWLERLCYAVGVYKGLVERQERERRHMVEIVREIMDEAVPLALSHDIKAWPDQRPLPPAVPGYIGFNDDANLEEEEYEVPF